MSLRFTTRHMKLGSIGDDRNDRVFIIVLLDRGNGGNRKVILVYIYWNPYRTLIISLND